MSTFFGYSMKELISLGGQFTATEITQQPKLWKEIIALMQANKKKISDFLSSVQHNNSIRIILTGAGSSAFIGETVTPYLSKILPYPVEAISTTDIVTNPQNYLKRNIPTLLVSYARSGNSPESIAAVNIAEKTIENLYHIFLTCNSEGELAKKAEANINTLLLLMPEDSNDQGFAMTSSFTCMVLASLLLFNLNNLHNIEKEISYLSDVGELILNNKIDVIKEINMLDYNRVVFLGSSTLKGLAKESALKILELTAGRVTSIFDSFLGFRHGPKSIIDDNTLVFAYLSNDKYVRQYEVDLLRELALEEGNKKVVVLSQYNDEEAKMLSDFFIPLVEKKIEFMDDIFLLFDYIIFAQVYAFLRSVNIGILPDNPSPGGKVNRVVKGVQIYNYDY